MVALNKKMRPASEGAGATSGILALILPQTVARWAVHASGPLHFKIPCVADHLHPESALLMGGHNFVLRGLLPDRDYFALPRLDGQFRGAPPTPQKLEYARQLLVEVPDRRCDIVCEHRDGAPTNGSANAKI